jgi:hypothetical protein
MKRLIIRPRSLVLVAVLAVTAAMCSVSTANAASSASEGVIPAAPSNLTATAVGTTSVHLTWTNNASNQSGVVISRNGVESVDLQGATVSSYTWNGLSPGTKYWFYVASKIYGTPGDPTGSGNTQSAWVGPVYATTVGHPPPKTIKSGNWNGYITQRNVNFVSSASQWVGLGGVPSNLLQIGVVSYCALGVQVNDAFWEDTATQSNQQIISFNVHPGDLIYASVEQDNSKQAQLTISDNNTGLVWSMFEQPALKTTPKSAEWIVEAGGVPLANFGTVNCVNCYYGDFGGPLAPTNSNSSQVIQVTPHGSATAISSITKGADGPSFSVNYVRSS